MKIRARIFMDTELNLGALVEPSGDTAHYLISVMRLKAGKILPCLMAAKGNGWPSFSPYLAANAN